MKSTQWFLKIKFLLCVSVACAICGVALIHLGPVFLDILLVLHPYSIIYKYWKTIPTEVVTDFHLFNWTNSEDIYNASVKPNFQVMGPYRYWQTEEKKNVTWNENGTVTYLQQRFWRYDDRKGNLSDKIVTINTIALGASYITRKWNYWVRRGMFLSLYPFFREISVTKTADELLFKGYPEPLLHMVNAIPFFSNFDIPKWDRFGWCYKRNGSLDFYGLFNVGTGLHNTTFGELYSWNNQKKTNFFGDDCSTVNGSATEFFPKNLKKDFVAIFSSDMRRIGKLKFQKEEYIDDILGYTYTIDDMMLDNGTIYPQNKCFCNGECVPSGMFNISSSKPGIPLFASLPHFYKADPYYINSVEGLEPDGSEHEFSMTIEPNTGIPLQVLVNVQLNLLVQPVSGVPSFENVRKIFFPVVWTKQVFKLEKFQLFLVKVLLNLSTICISIGAGMVISSSAVFGLIIYRKFKKRQVPLWTEFEEKIVLAPLCASKSKDCKKMNL